VVNLAVAVLLAMVAGAAFEWWRRGRTHVYQWHLRDGLALIFFISLVGAWYAYEQRRSARQWQILAREDSGGTRSSDVGTWQKSIRGPTWLRMLIGEAPFQFMDRVIAIDAVSERLPTMSELPDVRVVRIDDDVAGDELQSLAKMPRLEALDLDPPRNGFHMIRHLGRESPDRRSQTLNLPQLPTLRHLDLSNKQLHFQGIGNCPNLQVLGLSMCYVDENLLREVAMLPKLERLSLNFSRVPAGGIGLLAPSPKLARLELNGVELNDDDARDFRRLKGLRELELNYSLLTKRGLGLLAQLELRSLHLSRCQVDDELLPRFTRMASLRSLILTETAVTSRSLQELQRAEQLTELTLPGAKFTPSERAQLAAALPECYISYQE
jgi:hypothetical protein